jgi:predicted TPR repeat methyltransferase
MTNEDGAEAAGGAPSAATSQTHLSLQQAMDLAVGLHQKGMLDAAEELYDRILAVEPEHVDALHLLGLCRYLRKDTDRALELVRRAVELAPNHVDAISNLGNLLLEKGELPAAQQAYRRALELRPDFVNAQANLGIALRRAEDMPAAEEALRRAIELDPKHGAAHHNLGTVLLDSHRLDEALTHYLRALELMPYDADSFRRVGATLYSLGRTAEAAAAYQRWVALEPENPIALHMLAAASGQGVPERASDEFVQITFDSFATTFDSVLGRLLYKAPQLVADAVVARVTQPPAGTLDVLDVGAGTGLCGPLLRPYARRLVGIDLSKGMLEKAHERNIYDHLELAELTAYMSAPGQAARYDLIVSADTLVYLGDLKAALGAAAAALRPEGLLVFTLERIEEDDPEGQGGVRLMPHGRYAHTERYVRTVLAAAGFDAVQTDKVHPRTENRAPVEGLLVSARRRT